MKTDDLIERLARGVAPVAPLPRPEKRAATWLVGAAVFVGLLALMMTSSADLSDTGDTWRFVLPQIAAVAVSAAAAVAAFSSVVPGVSSRVLIWPAMAVTAWIGILLVGSVQEWQTAGSASLASPREWVCVVMIGVGGALPALAMARMLRDGAPLAPRVTSALVVLAAAGLANVGACVSHPHSSSAVVLVWHGATIGVLVAVGAWLLHSWLSWDRIQLARRT